MDEIIFYIFLTIVIIIGVATTIILSKSDYYHGKCIHCKKDIAKLFMFRFDQCPWCNLNHSRIPEKFISKFHCSSCDSVLSTYERLHSSGCCPYCGFISNSTICKTKQKAYELINGKYQEVIK
jgi:predicted RNA-binding Zn-ribbon protein involved in translation (DUF1610 family)